MSAWRPGMVCRSGDAAKQCVKYERVLSRRLVCSDRLCDLDYDFLPLVERPAPRRSMLHTGAAMSSDEAT